MPTLQLTTPHVRNQHAHGRTDVHKYIFYFHSMSAGRENYNCVVQNLGMIQIYAEHKIDPSVSSQSAPTNGLFCLLFVRDQ